MIANLLDAGPPETPVVDAALVELDLTTSRLSNPRNAAHFAQLGRLPLDRPVVVEAWLPSRRGRAGVVALEPWDESLFFRSRLRPDGFTLCNLHRIYPAFTMEGDSGAPLLSAHEPRCVVGLTVGLSSVWSVFQALQPALIALAAAAELQLSLSPWHRDATFPPRPRYQRSWSSGAKSSSST